jgi:hypothetical protein
MNSLITRLLEILKDLEPAAGADPQSLPDILRYLAAMAIQEDASLAVIPPDDIDPRIVEAIQGAIDLVAVLAKTSNRLRIDVENLPVGTPVISDHSGEQISDTFGPFVQREGSLIRFKAFLSAAFLHVLVNNPATGLSELQILIPRASTPDTPDLTNWTLAPGSVWIASRFLVNGTTGFTGLRIKGGTMQLGSNTVRPDASTILLPFF